MSRHRAVRNLNLDEELAEDYDHDVDFLGMPCRLTTDELSPEDQDALEQALLTVIDTLGEPEVCGISERRMKEALWDTYFDAPAAVNLLLEAKEQEEAQARKRADGSTDVGTSAKAPRLQLSEPKHTPPAPTERPPMTPRDPAPESSSGRPVGHANSPLASTAPKKLSKLQQKMQANREKKGASASRTSSANLARLLSPKVASPSATPAPVPPAEPVSVAPSGTQLSTLFPHTRPQGPFSPFGQILRDDGRPSTSPQIGLPTRTDAEMEQLRAAFSQLSPDDVIQQARQGTRLAR